VSTKHGIEHAFAIGAAVEVLADRNMIQGDVWKIAVIEKHAPYLGRAGYYVNYPDAKQMHECRGGWMPEHLVRAKKTEDRP
jgi:hypothetical protein